MRRGWQGWHDWPAPWAATLPYPQGRLEGKRRARCPGGSSKVEGRVKRALSQFPVVGPPWRWRRCQEGSKSECPRCRRSVDAATHVMPGRTAPRGHACAHSRLRPATRRTLTTRSPFSQITNTFCGQEGQLSQAVASSGGGRQQASQVTEQRAMGSSWARHRAAATSVLQADECTTAQEFLLDKAGCKRLQRQLLRRYKLACGRCSTKRLPACQPACLPVQRVQAGCLLPPPGLPYGAEGRRPECPTCDLMSRCHTCMEWRNLMVTCEATRAGRVAAPCLPETRCSTCGQRWNRRTIGTHHDTASQHRQ